MAKDKKTVKELTMEEKLAQALVPVEEQPYKIPENWCWTTVGNIAKIIMGQSPESSSTTEDSSFMPLVGGAADMGKMFPKVTRYTKKPTKICNKGDLILCIRATLGRPIFADKEYCIGRGVAGIRIIGGNNEFFRYFFLNFEDYLYEKATGSTFAQVNSVILQNMPVPLPPLKEQRRIIDRIESIFTKLDEAKEKAQAVVDGFELRKSAILRKAFTGELTKQWRKSRGISIESWRTVPLIEISTLQTGIMKGKHFNDKTICLPYLRVANVQDGYFNLKEIKRIEVSEKMVDRYLLQKGDVLFTEGGDFDKLGRGSVWNAEIKVCLHQNHVFVIRPDKKILDPYFLSLQAGSRYGKKYFLSCAKQTTNLASINSTQLKNYPVRLPVIEEQKAILNMVSDVLKKERQVKDAAELVISQIDVMKKAVLARAFRGELGTNDLLEEKSVELLKLVF